MPFSIGDHLGAYEILASIGAGGMGEVYRARDTKLDRDVAIKILPAAFASDAGRMARFEREAKVLASLNHPNIAHVYGVEDRALVMELVEGESPKGPLPFDEAWKIASQIADALEYAHERGVIHRDLKPANVKVTPDEVVKLLDFGLAKAYSDSPDSTGSDPENSPTVTLGATVAGTIMGTAAYMAPEQARGKKVDKRADIWSWGVVVYELLTGERPFTGDDVSNTLAQVLTKEPDLDRIPATARKLLRRCLDKDSTKRLRHIGDVRDMLDEPAPPQLRPGTAGWIVTGVLAVIGATLWLMQTPATPPERAYQLSVLPPEGTSFAFAAASGSHALSPDGRTLAFVAEANGAMQIWLRPLDGTVARRLDGTGEAYGVSWSPDGRYLAFPTPGKLRRIELATGNVRDLCPAFDVRGVTWSQQGTIVFAQTSVGLWRVSAEGGEPEITVTRDFTRGEEQLYWPQFLPDGRHFLYLVRSAKLALTGTYVAALDSKPEAQGRIQILANTRNSLYTLDTARRNGFLLFLRGRTLVAQRFDGTKFRQEEEPITITEDVGSSMASNYAGFAISAGGVLAYSGQEADRYRVELVGRDGGTLRIIGDPDRYIGITVSHNEKQIGLWRFEPSQGTYDIWLMDVVTGLASRFTTDPASDVYPAWSPDDEEIIFSSSRQGPYNLFRKQLAKGHERRVQVADRAQLAGDWSPDRKLLVYEEYASSNARDLWALPIEGGNPIPLANTQFDERQSAVSPSGRWLAYVSNESGSYDVYVQAFPHTGRKWRITNGGGLFPRWSADEKELFYSTPDNLLMAMAVHSESADFGYTSPKALFPLKSAAFSLAAPFWRPINNGQRFLVLRPAEPAQGKPITIVTNWRAELKK